MNGFKAFYLAFLLLSGCGFKETAQKELPVLRVDGYEILESEIQIEIQKLKGIHPKASDAMLREKAIDLLINQTVLLEEAEKQKINMNRKFLDSVESYWRQGLLQELTRKKMEEIRQKIVVDKTEISRLYEALSHDYQVRQLLFDPSLLNLPEDCSTDSFQKVLSEHPDKILMDSGWIWTDLLSLDPEIRNEILKAGFLKGKTIRLKKKGGTLFLLGMLEMKEANREPFDKIQADLKQQLETEQSEKELERWMEELKEKAKIER